MPRAILSYRDQLSKALFQAASAARYARLNKDSLPLFQPTRRAPDFDEYN